MESKTSLTENKYVKNPITIFLISLILTYIISIFNWLGIVIGPLIAGLLITSYKKTIIINLAAGFLAWSLLFTQNIMIYGEPAVKAYAITGNYYIIAIIVGMLLAMLGGIVGTAIINIAKESRNMKSKEE